MNVAAILALNGVYVLVGAALVHGFRGYASPREAVRLLGVSYMLGVGATVVACAILLALEVPFGGWTIGLVALGLCAFGALLPRFRRRQPPAGEPPAPEPIRFVGAAAAGFSLGYLALLLDLAPRLGMAEADAWTFWTPKAQAIWYYGRLHEPTFTSLPGATYPLFVPVMEAIDFTGMGEADAMAIHLQFVLLLGGFVWALSGLLRPYVPRAFLWPVILLMLIAPELNYRALTALADFPLDYFFALSAVCLGRWIETRQTWLLVLGASFLGVAMSVKREGQLLAVALVVGCLVASWRSRGWAYPRLLLAVGLAALTTVPWRVWWMSRGLTGEAPATSPSDWLDSLSRVWPSFELLVGRLLSWDLWYLVFPLAVAAAVLVVVLFPTRRATATLYLTTCVLVIASFTWVFVAEPELPTTVRGDQPAPRAMASLIFLSVAFLPLLLGLLGSGQARSSVAQLRREDEYSPARGAPAEPT
jgi:hypothetical protein